MLNKKLNKVSFSSGFTLIELMIVIVILAILAVVVIVAINPAQRIASADNAKTQSDLASFGSSASQFAAQNGGYPQTWAAATGGSTTAANNWSVAKGILDGTGSAYVYTAYGTAGSTTACGNSTGVVCQAASISGISVADGTSTFAGLWCWRSATGLIANVTTTTGCAP